MKNSLVSVVALAALAAAGVLPPSTARAEKPKQGTAKYYAEETVQRIGFDLFGAGYTLASPIAMVTGSIASDIPYAPVRNWGEGLMVRSMTGNVLAQQALGLGLRGMTGADPNQPGTVIPVGYDFKPGTGTLKKIGIVAGSHVAAAIGGVLYTAVVPLTTIVGSVATLLPWDAAKQWGRDALAQDVYGAKVSQDFLAFALSGKMVDVPTTVYPIATYQWGWDDGRTAPTKTTPAASGSQTAQRPSVGIEPGTHVSLPGANGGFHH